MSQTADIQLTFPEEILQILRNQALTIPTSSTSSRYLQAFNSLSASIVGTHGSCVSELSGESAAGLSQGETNSSFIIHSLSLTLTNWLVNLWLMCTPYATASLYLDIISSLYGSAAKANLLPPTKLFSQLKSSLKALGPDGWRQGINDEIFDRALRLTKNADYLIADDRTAAQMVIWSLAHNLLPLEQIAQLKKSNEDNSSLIVNRSSLKKPRYLFPLRQSYRTPKQLQSHINNIVNALFRRARLPQATNPQVTIDSLWAYAALRAGIPASDLVSHLGSAPLGLPILRLSHANQTASDGGEQQAARDLCLHVSDLESSKKNFAALREIGRVFLENPPQWYAMSLRPGVRFTQICHRIDQLSSEHSATQPLSVSLFYPSEEITRAIGKKIVTRQRPFIHSVVFFRAKLTDIARLFSKIGDLAWCYRQSARPGAPYAHISDDQFRLFQQTIAQFTPDYEVAPTGELKLNEGDRVEILGGLFTGHEATFDSIVKAEEGVVYRLNIVGDNGFDWRISVDKRLAHHKN